MTTRSSKTPFTDVEVKALRLLKRRHRSRAVELAFGFDNGSLSALKKLAVERGWSFPPMPRNATPISEAEYIAACRDGGVEPKPDMRFYDRGKADGVAWPHLQTYPEGPARSPEAAAQAQRILARTKTMRHVPPTFAGGGEYHFGRECAEHLAALIARAPGPRYIDDPRALRPERRETFSPPSVSSFGSCALAEIVEAA